MPRELAYAKLNLVLHVGRPREDGLHPICSLFASIDLADEVTATPLDGGEDTVECPGVPGNNLAGRALTDFRARGGRHLPPLAIAIDKRIPIAAGLGGGSADAAATLRLANELADGALAGEELHRLAADLGSDVPSQLDPTHALVQGAGEQLEPIRLPPFAAVLVPDPQGLSAGEVYAELDRLDACRSQLDSKPLRDLANAPLPELAANLHNDLQRAVLSLRPELEGKLQALRDAGALGAAVSGSGPTCFGLFPDRAAADQAAAQIPGALVALSR